MLKFLCFSCLLLTSIAPVINAPKLLAQTAPATPAQTDKSLRTTDQLIDQVCSFLQSQKSFTVDMDVTYDEVLESGNKVQYSAYQKLSVAKPNRLRSDYVGDQRVTNFYYDGTSFTLQSPSLKYYNTKPAPTTLDAVLDQIDEKYGITVPMSNLVASDPCKDFKANVQETLFVGDDMVEREPMYHILLLGNDRDFQMWVTQDEPPLLRKAIITYKNLPDSPQYTVLLSNWNFNPQIPENTFTFTPSKDDIKIEFLPVDKLNPMTNDSQTAQ